MQQMAMQFLTALDGICTACIGSLLWLLCASFVSTPERHQQCKLQHRVTYVWVESFTCRHIASCGVSSGLVSNPNSKSNPWLMCFLT